MTVEMYPSPRFRQTENKFNQRNERESCLVILSSLDSRYFGILGLIIDTITLIMFFVLLEVFFIDALYFHSIQIFYLSLKVVF